MTPRKLENVLGEFVETPLPITLILVAFAACAGSLEYLRNRQSSASKRRRDVALAAILGSAAAFLPLAALKLRRRTLLDPSTTVQFDHLVRNALQAIVDCQYIPSSVEQRTAVLTSVGRIEDTLRKLLPAEHKGHHNVVAAGQLPSI